MEPRDVMRLHELLKESNDACEVLVNLMTKARQYYNEAEIEPYKEMFKKINNGIAKAGETIAKTGAEISAIQIDLLLDVLNELSE